MIAADPFQGGATWAVLQYLLGFRRLGPDVYFAEPLPEKSVRPAGSPLVQSTNAAYFRQVVEQFGLEHNSALFRPDTREIVGTPYEQLCDVARRADVLV